MIWNFELDYFREGNSSGTPDAVARVDLEPYETRSFADALRNAGLFGVAGDQKGYFEVRRQYYYYLTYSGWLQNKVYNQAPAGSFGMQIPVRYAWDGTSTRPFSTGCATAPTAPTSAWCRCRTRARRRGCA